MTDWFKRYYKKLADSLKVKQGKIRNKLIVSFVFIIVLSIFSIGFISYYLSTKNMEKTMIDASKQATSQIVENLEFNFQHINTILLIPYYNPNFMDNIKNYGTLDEMHRFIYNRKVNDWFIRSLYLYTRKDLEGVYIFFDTGDLIYNSINFETNVTANEIRNAGWFKEAIKSDGKIVFLGVGRSLFNPKKKVFLASRLIKNDLSDRFTIMLAEFNTKVFNDICSKVYPDGGGKIVIADEDGHIVYSTDNRQNLMKLNHNLFQKVRTQDNSFWFKEGKQEYLITSTESPTTNWKVISLVPKKLIYANSIRVRNYTIIITVLASLACAFISLLLAAKISKPITRLLRTFDKVKQGDYSVRVKITDEYDEVSQIGVSFNAMIAQIEELITNKYINELRLRDAELDYLHSQINPHFLYNTLDCIKSMAEWNEIGAIPLMITSLSDMFRYSIKDKRKLVTIAEELQNIQRYLTIQKIRFNDKFTIEFQVDQKILTAKILKFILQPIVENAVFHGLEKKKEKGLLKISGYLNPAAIFIEITDNGVGINQESLQKLQKCLKENEMVISPDSYERSIGLINVHTRLCLSYGNNYGLNITSTEGIGTSVIVKIPLKNDTDRQLGGETDDRRLNC